MKTVGVSGARNLFRRIEKNHTRTRNSSPVRRWKLLQNKFRAPGCAKPMARQFQSRPGKRRFDNVKEVVSNGRSAIFELARWLLRSQSGGRREHMNENTQELKRNRSDFISFGVIFFGFVLAAGGMIVNSIGGSLTGVVLMLIGLVYFLLRDTDLD